MGQGKNRKGGKNKTGKRSKGGHFNRLSASRKFRK